MQIENLTEYEKSILVKGLKHLEMVAESDVHSVFRSSRRLLDDIQPALDNRKRRLDLLFDIGKKLDPNYKRYVSTMEPDYSKNEF